MRYATPLPINRTPVSTVGGPFPPFCGTPGLISIACSVQAHPMNTTTHSVPTQPVGSHAFRCLPMNTTMTLFLHFDPAMYTSPGRTYARVGVRDPARMYTYMVVFSFLHPGRCTYVYMLRARLYYDTCTPLHPLLYMYVHVRDQNDKATYASTMWVPTVRHLFRKKGTSLPTKM